MRYTEQFDDNIDIYSSYQDISSSSKPQKKKKKKKRKNTFVKVLVVILCIVLVASIALYGYAYYLINKIDRQPLESEDLNITTNQYDSVKNIALLGIDSRKDNDSGRSDAVLVLTIDKQHKKIKLTSIARDTYVQIDGHSQDKLTHAYAYGKSDLAVKTLNKNFDLEITDYVTVNFFGFARIIDYIGGVTIDVDKKEMNNLNSTIIPEINKKGLPCEKIKKTGLQQLTGAQAMCYSRIRKVDSDIMRGNRQKEVLSAMFDKVKGMSVTKLPALTEMILSECKTSLSTNDIMSMGMWAVTSSPEIVNLSIPNDNIKSSGKIIRGVRYYVYDLETAKQEIKDFIFETGNYSEDKTTSDSN